MDQAHKHNIQTQCQFSKFQSAKKAIKILLSLSLFSFLFSYTSLFPFFLHFFDHHFSTFYMELFSYSTGRNYIFLLCNGILVFLIKNSGLIDNSPLSSDHRDDHTNENHGSVSELSDTRAVVKDSEIKVKQGKPNVGSVSELSETRAVVKESEIQVEQGKPSVALAAAVNENMLLTTQEEDCDMQENQFLADEIEEGIEELLSAEELNKKCDDFIKKMREGIRSESQRVILV